MSIIASSSPRRRQYISKAHGETSQPMKKRSLCASTGSMQAEEEIDLVLGEPVCEHLLARRARQGEADRLVECALPTQLIPQKSVWLPPSRSWTMPSMA